MKENSYLNDNSSKSELQNTNSRKLLLMELTRNVFREDLMFRIIVEFYRNDEITLRKLARRVGLSYSKTADKLQYLMDIGLIEYTIADNKMKIYRLKESLKKLKYLFVQMKFSW